MKCCWKYLVGIYVFSIYKTAFMEENLVSDIPVLYGNKNTSLPLQILRQYFRLK